MERTLQWPVPLAAIGTIIVTAATFWRYALDHHEGLPGGYLPIAIGTLLVGLLVALCSYFARPTPLRRAFPAIASGVVASIAFMIVLLATLIASFGS